MEHYVRRDVSLKQTAIYIVDQTRTIVSEEEVASDPEAMAEFIKSHAPHVARVGLETGATSTRLWTELNELGLPVICINARRTQAAPKTQTNKSDRSDALGIARFMQCGWYREVRVKDLDIRTHFALAAILPTTLNGNLELEPEPQFRGIGQTESFRDIGQVIHTRLYLS